MDCRTHLCLSEALEMVYEVWFLDFYLATSVVSSESLGFLAFASPCPPPPGPGCGCLNPQTHSAFVEGGTTGFLIAG